jgi:hypothetical protein
MAAEAARLRFDWPAKSRLPLTLLGFCAFSLFCHALAFYLFQIVYPPPVAVAPPPAQVTLLDTMHAPHEALLQWIDAEDPARIFLPEPILPRGLMEMPYRPSYSDVVIAPQPALEFARDISLPPPTSSVRKRQSSAAKPIAGSGTIVRFDNELSRRAITQTPDLSVTPADSVLEPSRYLVGVNSDGAVQFVFLQKSSGNSAADVSGERQLQQTKFSTSGTDLEWGWATVYWGIEAYRTTNPK